MTNPLASLDRFHAQMVAETASAHQAEHVTSLSRLAAVWEDVVEARGMFSDVLARIGPIDPGGGDRIDELESAIGFLQRRANRLDDDIEVTCHCGRRMLPILDAPNEVLYACEVCAPGQVNVSRVAARVPSEPVSPCESRGTDENANETPRTIAPTEKLAACKHRWWRRRRRGLPFGPSRCRVCGLTKPFVPKMAARPIDSERKQAV